MKLIPILSLIFAASLPNVGITDEVKNPLHYLPRELEIELALAAGPEQIRKEASVYIFGKSGYEKVREGKNGFTCFVNRDGYQHGDRTLRPTCWDPEGTASIVPVMMRVGELIAQRKSASDIQKDIDSNFENKHFFSPRRAGIAYMLKGDVTFNEKKQQLSETVFPAHYMFYALGISNKDLGVDEKAINTSLPFVYDGYTGGKRIAYIIVPVLEDTRHIH